MNNTPNRSVINEFINLAAAVIPWIFPDIPTSIKALISTVLACVVLLSHHNTNFIAHYWKPVYYLSTILSPVILGIISWIVTFFLLNIFGYEWEIDITAISRAVQMGIAYGVVVGVPATLIGASNRTAAEKSIYGGGLGCAIQFVILVPTIMIPLVEFTSQPLSNLELYIFGIMSPASLFMYELANTFSIDTNTELQLTAILCLLLNFGFVFCGNILANAYTKATSNAVKPNTIIGKVS